MIDGWGSRTIENELAKGVDFWWVKPINAVVKVEDIPVIMSEENIALINFYWCYRKMGNPFEVNWYSWPCTVFDLISILEDVQWGDMFK